ncbi:unnamed protein product [Phytomonas sp. EM1]|nr:unnamed protein product [Phytomonas sp. EM1]|eukprot:CCW65542.1 unnamed protein product [Phytomonas sp. isolate EM1]
MIAITSFSAAQSPDLCSALLCSLIDKGEEEGPLGNGGCRTVCPRSFRRDELIETSPELGVRTNEKHARPNAIAQPGRYGKWKRITKGNTLYCPCIGVENSSFREIAEPRSMIR